MASVFSFLSPILSSLGSILPYLSVYLTIWIFVTVLWWAFKGERFGVSGLPYYLIYRTTRLNNWIQKISASAPTAWRTVWNVGVVTGIGSMIYIFYQLLKNLLNLLFSTGQAFSVQPIVPLPGFVSFETFPYLVLALSVVVISHELSHGIASLVDRVPLKSTGAFFAHVLMGGFVEPDEEKLNQAKNLTKLRVFAAGSFTNVVLGVLCLVLLANFTATIAPFYSVVASGVSIGSVPDNLPAHSSGLQSGDIVTNINGTRISDLSDLQRYMSRVVPGQSVVIGTQRGSYAVRTAPDMNNASHALIGISGLTDNIVYNPKLPLLSSEFPPVLAHAEYWLFIVLVSVALINMLPMAPFDGDKFLETALNILGISNTKDIRTVANSAAYAVLLLNIGLSFYRFGFLRF
jgi:membrane-associated protease RseP (regulator of RpoE activity)